MHKLFQPANDGFKVQLVHLAGLQVGSTLPAVLGLQYKKQICHRKQHMIVDAF